MTFDVVVPTVGRDSLGRLLDALGSGASPGRVLVVDDRRERSSPLLPAGVPEGVEVVPGRGAGPAAARNAGWRRATAEWVAFLDDDVVPSATWVADLVADLSGLGPDVAGSQGRIVVPMPVGRRPTDWERNVRGLETARWATADMAYRREVLAEVGGFDERFPRAYREDADLGLRVVGAGYRIVRGRRVVTHPVRPVGRFVSVRLQAGNADDVLMWGVHGAGWRSAAGVPGGRRPRHLVVTGLGLLGLLGAGGVLLARRGVPQGGLALPPGTTVGRAETPLRSPTSGGSAWGGRRGRWARRVAGLGGLGWLAGTAELAIARIAPGPRTADEVVTMALTSVLLPAAATGHWLAGWARLPRLLADRERAPRPICGPATSSARVAAATSALPVSGNPSSPADPRQTRRPLRQPGVLASAGRAVPSAGQANQSTAAPATGRAASRVFVASASPTPVSASISTSASPAPRGSLSPFGRVPKAVLLDRDGTLVADVPYNGDPERVVVMPGAREAVERLRAAGVATAVVSNQSGVARGLLRVEQVEAVNRRVEELLGPLGPWLYCVHGPWEGCGCRKPAPGLIEAAAGVLEVATADCVVIGDIGSDVEAARAAGARAVLVPTAGTRTEEVAAAPVVAPDLLAAVELVLRSSGGRPR